MFVKILVFTSVFLIILWVLVQNFAYFLLKAVIRKFSIAQWIVKVKAGLQHGLHPTKIAPSRANWQ